jgi:hypothetical protein
MTRPVTLDVTYHAARPATTLEQKHLSAPQTRRVVH